MIKKINYAALKAGDIIGTTSFSWFATLAKITTAKWGKKFLGIFDPYFSTHTLVVMENIGGLKYGIEMTWPQIRCVDLHNYENGNFGQHIVFVGRNQAVAQISDKVNLWLAKSHAQFVKYDWRGVLEFWNIVADDDQKWICSELPREMLRTFAIEYPAAWNKEVSPIDWQHWNQLSQINWWK